MFKTRIALMLAAAALPASVLAACGDDDDDTATPTGTAAETASPAAGASASPAASATPGGISLDNPTTTPSGLKYEDNVVGTGASPQSGQRVTVHYTGTFVDGTKFDSSVDRGQPFTFVIGMGNVIKGWDEGVATMKVGGKRVLYIPSALAYGTRGQGPIPPNTDLVFEVELLGIE